MGYSPVRLTGYSPLTALRVAPAIGCQRIGAESAVWSRQHHTGIRCKEGCLTTASGQTSTYHRQRSGCQGRPWGNRVSSLPDGCAGSSDISFVAMLCGLSLPTMAHADGPGRERCKATASFAMVKHTEALTASGPVHGYSCPWQWGQQHRDKGQGMHMTSQLPKKKGNWQSCHHRPQAKYTHTLRTRRWCI